MLSRKMKLNRSGSVYEIGVRALLTEKRPVSLGVGGRDRETVHRGGSEEYIPSGTRSWQEAYLAFKETHVHLRDRERI